MTPSQRNCCSLRRNGSLALKCSHPEHEEQCNESDVDNDDDELSMKWVGGNTIQREAPVPTH